MNNTRRSESRGGLWTIPTPPQTRPILIAGVAGGVGTSTAARLLALTRIEVHDLGRYLGGPVDVVVTSTHARATRALLTVLDEIRRHPQAPQPVVVVVGIAPVTPSATRARLRAATPYLADLVTIPYIPDWVGRDDPLGDGIELPKGARKIPRALVEALHRMWPPAAAQPAQFESHPLPPWSPAQVTGWRDVTEETPHATAQLASPLVVDPDQ
ncbi:hypothetical protein F0L68_17295 [Solihabitans fulvus]|uniref:Uncharacterized protein n=1 Tax=Solihabitans fulvus TaxID=1892852 RepID=A0A5B2XCZ3_9PSEU|nr:hypothetical protein F0L68_17295 [Solihabitans fulvus]